MKQGTRCSVTGGVITIVFSIPSKTIHSIASDLY